MKDTEYKIKEIINRLKPYLENDGGNIEFVKYENNIVYVKFYGSCSDCEFLDYTIKDGIESALKEEIPEIIKVESFE